MQGNSSAGETADSITKSNEDASDRFNGGAKADVQPGILPEDNSDVIDVNNKASAEFNGEGEDLKIGTRVGGIRGNSD